MKKNFLFLETFKEYNRYKRGDILTKKEMIDYILDNNLRDYSGEFDYNEAKEIAYTADKWMLDYFYLDNIDYIASIEYENPSKHAYPIILKIDDDDYRILDGKHRIVMAKEIGKNKILSWIGIINE